MSPPDYVHPGDLKHVKAARVTVKAKPLAIIFRSAISTRVLLDD